MGAIAESKATNNAHSAVIDGSEYEVTDLQISCGGTTDGIMSGADGGYGRDLTTSKRCTVTATILVPASGSAGSFEAMNDYACTFLKKTGVAVAGTFKLTQDDNGGATSSAMRRQTTWVSQGEFVLNNSGSGSPG